MDDNCFLPFALPEIGDEELSEVLATLRSGWLTTGKATARFEEEFRGYTAAPHALAVNSCTAGLHLALAALGVGPGDEVITTPLTFCATVNVILQVGAQPVLADIGPDLNIDPEAVKRALSPRTRAVLPVHLFGRPCEMACVLAAAARHGLKVVEDCAQSFGSRFHGKPSGTLGHMGAFSFFPTKNLSGCGDGGLVATDDDQLADLARALRVHGSRRKYHNEVVGYNSRLDELQAALLRVKLPHVDDWNAGRVRAAEAYQDFLEGDDLLQLPDICDGHVFNQYTVRIRGRHPGRDRVQARMAEEGIDTMVYYPVPCHRLKVYEQSHADVSCPEADKACAEVLSLPLWPGMDEGVQAQVASILSAILREG